MSIILTIQPTDDINNYLGIIETNGGGILNFNPIDTFVATEDIVLPSNTIINANGGTLDLDGQYQVVAEGQLIYDTGTVSISYDSSTLTGSGTSWDADLVGYAILIGDFWYFIDSVESATSLTLDVPFMGEDLVNDTYIVAETVDSTGLSNVTVQNTTGSAIRGRYVNGFIGDKVNAYDSDIGFDFEDSANINMPFFETYGCATYSMLFNNVPYTTLNNFAILAGGPVSLTRVTNSAIGAVSFQAMTGSALILTNCSNLGMTNYAIIGTGDHAVEMASGNSDVDLISGYYANIGGDGIKLTDTTDGITMNNNSFKSCVGYDVNIANANCDNNIIIANGFTGAGSGAVNNLGTGTIIRSNSGVADN